MKDKRQLREDIRRLKSACSATERAQLSDTAAAHLLRMPQWAAAKTILLYYSLPDEADTRKLLDNALHCGKRVLLPVVVGNELELREYNGEESLEEGAYHILEPRGTAFDDYNSIDLAIIPGVAFTRGGHRLGRGRGYYDRLLPRLKATYKIGLCWPFQIVDSLPVESHDILMDTVCF